MSDEKVHWTAELNRNYRTEDGEAAWVLRYDPTPGGVKNPDGSTTLSMNFPALQLTAWVSEPENAARDIARWLNSGPGLLDALIAARSELEACEAELSGEGYNNPEMNSIIAKASAP